ncbi:hypothetical protein H0H87_000498 [Tephrocybe sp. NHM501043]|nr:hypothetical protein H0H87_000498 [Tephrocybe sp. NHM501043]
MSNAERGAHDELIRKGRAETKQGMAAYRGTVPSGDSINQGGQSTSQVSTNSAGVGASTTDSKQGIPNPAFSNTDGSAASGPNITATGATTTDRRQDTLASSQNRFSLTTRHSHEITSATGARHHRDDAVTHVNAVPGQQDHGISRPSTFNQTTAPSYVENKEFGEGARMGGQQTFSLGAGQRGVGGNNPHDQPNVDSAGRQTELENSPQETAGLGRGEASSGEIPGGHGMTSTSTGSGNTTGRFHPSINVNEAPNHSQYTSTNVHNPFVHPDDKTVGAGNDAAEYGRK